MCYIITLKMSLKGCEGEEFIFLASPPQETLRIVIEI